MRHLYLLLLSLATILLAGCDGKEQKQFYRESLLAIQADDRAGIQATSDSAITEIIQYFEAHPDKELLPLAYFYGARTYRQLQDVPMAMHYLHRVLDETDESDSNHYLRARAYAQIGYIAYQQNLFPEAIEAAAHTIPLDSLDGNLSRMAHAYYDMARYHIILSQYGEAEAANCRATGYYTELQDTSMLFTMEEQRAHILASAGNRTLAQPLYDQLLPQILESGDCSMLANAARFYYDWEDIQEAELLASKVLQLEGDHFAKFKAARLLARIAIQQNKPEAGLNYLEESILHYEAAYGEETTLQVAQIHSQYDYRLRAEESKRLAAEIEGYRLWFVVILLTVLLLLLTIVSGMLYLRKKKTESQARQARLEALLRENRLAHMDISALQSQLKEQEDQHLSFLQAQSSSQFILQLRENAATGKALTQAERAELKQYINQQDPTFLPRLQQVVSLSDLELNFTILIRLGFKNAEISLLLARHRSTISHDRQRLYEKTFQAPGSAEDWDKFILSL